MINDEDVYVPRGVGRPPISEDKIDAILVLRLKENLSYREISKKLHVSHETCRRYCLNVELAKKYKPKQE